MRTVRTYYVSGHGQSLPSMDGSCHALTPFDAIQFQRGCMGLCIPGLGTDRYEDMASALCTVLSITLEDAPPGVKMMMRSVERHRDGYDIMWRLLGMFVPGFDATKTNDRPLWSDSKGDAIDFADAYHLFFRLSSKANHNHTPRVQSKLYLEGITDPILQSIVNPLLIAVDTAEPYLGCPTDLPPSLLIPELALTIMKRTTVDTCTTAELPHYYGASRIATIQPSPSSPTNIYSSETDQIGHIQGYCVAGIHRPPHQHQKHNTSGDGRRRPQPQQPDQTRRTAPDTPTVTCKACGRKGHMAATCDFLAMSVIQQRYLKLGHGTSDDVAAAERRWLDRWKQRGGQPGSTTPRTVMAAYMEQYGVSVEQLEDEIDWDCWPIEESRE